MPRLAYSAAIGFLCVLLVTATASAAPRSVASGALTSVDADAPPPEADVSGYKPVFTPFGDSKGIKIAIREFTRNDKKEVLYVNPETFSTGVLIWDEETFKKRPLSDVQKTLFVKALEKYNSLPVTLQNHSLKKAEMGKEGFFLTVDLCPSKKNLDKKIFTSAMELSHDEKPVPIGIAISGEWIKKHGQEFRWLAKEKKLRVTWINHGYTHPYSKDLPLEENFLLSKGVDFEREVLETEKLLLKNGITPSPFFRFPGLISDSGLVEKLKTLSLVPIGSQSWLAKKETPEKGGIILVHGNGNEPQGIKRLMAFYKENEAAFKKGELRFFPIEEAFEGK